MHARVRRNNVLRQMLEQGDDHVASHEGRGRRASRSSSTRPRRRDRYPYPYFVDYFKQWFLSNPAFGKTREDRYQLLFTGGLHITTTLDPQLPARRADARCVPCSPTPGDPSGAMTVIDPRTGYVRAMVGGARTPTTGTRTPATAA